MKKILDVIINKKVYDKPPIWIMRQAGRYLPEYREIRKNCNNFLDLCYNPELASEVTLQPIKRFGFDAAIIFSDILVIPDALGIDVKFVPGEGPKLQKISGKDDLKKLDVQNVVSFLKPVFDNLKLTRQNLDDDKALIGFSGSPFTLACYMIEGGGSKNFDLVKRSAIENEEFFSELIDILVEAVSVYLIQQVKFGADIIKLFDSWAGVLGESQFEKWVIEPNKRIVDNVRKKCPGVPIIAFPKGAGDKYERFADVVKPDVLAVDQNVSRKFVAEKLQKNGQIVQGNFDNQILAYGSKDMIEREVRDILDNFSQKPFIFNLGHGIIKDTKIENVEFLMSLLKS